MSRYYVCPVWGIFLHAVKFSKICQVSAQEFCHKITFNGETRYIILSVLLSIHFERSSSLLYEKSLINLNEFA